MSALNLLILVSLLVAAAAECPFSNGGANAPPKDNTYAPPPPDSGASPAPPTTTESPAGAPTDAPAGSPSDAPALAPTAVPTPAPAPAPSQNKTAGKLSTDYYANICPNLESLVQGAVRGMMASSPIAAAATLRLFFHDCFPTVSSFFMCFTNASH